MDGKNTGLPYPTAPSANYFQQQPDPRFQPQPPPPSYDAAMMNPYPSGPPGYGPPPPQQFGFVQPAPFHQIPQPTPYPSYPPAQIPNPQQPFYGQPFNPVPQVQPGPSVPYVAPVTAVFDSGARFNNGQITVPPPPPGYMPNAAQAAAMQGHSVHVQKEKNNFFSGGKGAGFTFW